MALRDITFSMPEDKLQALDTVAGSQQRDLGSVLNEAVTQYLSLQDYHRELIEEGIHQDDAGEVVDHETVKQMVASWAKPTAR